MFDSMTRAKHEQKIEVDFLTYIMVDMNATQIGRNVPSEPF